MNKFFIKNKSKFLILGLIVIFVLFLLPRSVDGFALDLASVQLDALSEKTGPVLEALFKGFLFQIGSFLLLFFSSNLLEGILASTPVMLNLNAPIVTLGWGFILGISNLLLVIAFIVIAFCTILKIERFDYKKLLPKLIIVALLINFSLLFVKIGVDVSNFFFNTILTNLTPGDQSLINTALKAIFSGSRMGIEAYLAITVGITLAMLVPYVNVYVQAGLVLGLPILLPFLFVMLAYGFIMFSMAMIFLLYSFIFLARVFIIQILAIFAPLAFLCLIFPNTKKYWDMWLKALVEWLFVGVIFLFLLGIGFYLIAFTMPDDITIYGFGWADAIIKVLFGQGMIYYIALLVYFLTVLFIGRKLIPATANMAIDQISGFAKGTLMPAAKQWGQGIKGLSEDYAIDDAKQREATEKKGEKLQFSAARTLLSTPGRWAIRARGSTVELEADKMMEREKMALKERFGKNIGAAEEVLSRPEIRRKRNPVKKAAEVLYFADAKGAKGLDKMEKKDLEEGIETMAAIAPHKVEDIVKHKPELVDNKNIGKLIQDTMVDKGLEDPDIKRMIDSGIEIDGESIQELIKSDAGKIKVIRKATFKKAMDALKTSDVENLADTTLNNEEFKEMVVRFKPSSFIQKIYDEKGPGQVDSIRKKMEELGPEEIVKTNAALLRQTVTNPGFRSTMPLPETGKFKEFKGLKNDKEKIDKINNMIMTAAKEVKEKTKKQEEEREKRKGRPGVGGPSTDQPPPASSRRERKERQKRGRPGVGGSSTDV